MSDMHRASYMGVERSVVVEVPAEIRGAPNLSARYSTIVKRLDNNKRIKAELKKIMAMLDSEDKQKKQREGLWLDKHQMVSGESLPLISYVDGSQHKGPSSLIKFHRYSVPLLREVLLVAECDVFPEKDIVEFDKVVGELRKLHAQLRKCFYVVDDTDNTPRRCGAVLKTSISKEDQDKAELIFQTILSKSNQYNVESKKVSEMLATTSELVRNTNFLEGYQGPACVLLTLPTTTSSTPSSRVAAVEENGAAELDDEGDDGETDFVEEEATESAGCSPQQQSDKSAERPEQAQE